MKKLIAKVLCLLIFTNLFYCGSPQTTVTQATMTSTLVINGTSYSNLQYEMGEQLNNIKCYIRCKNGPNTLWSVIYDNSTDISNQCKSKMIQIRGTEIYAVFTLQPTGNINDIGFLMNRTDSDTNAKNAFKNGLFTYIPPMANSYVQFDVLLKIDPTNGKILTGTVFYSSYTGLPDPVNYVDSLSIRENNNAALVIYNDYITIQTQSQKFPPEKCKNYTQDTFAYRSITGSGPYLYNFNFQKNLGGFYVSTTVPCSFTSNTRLLQMEVSAGFMNSLIQISIALFLAIYL